MMNHRSIVHFDQAYRLVLLTCVQFWTVLRGQHSKLYHNSYLVTSVRTWAHFADECFALFITRVASPAPPCLLGATER